MSTFENAQDVHEYRRDFGADRFAITLYVEDATREPHLRHLLWPEKGKSREQGFVCMLSKSGLASFYDSSECVFASGFSGLRTS